METELKTQKQTQEEHVKHVVIAWKGERMNSPRPHRRILYIYIWPETDVVRNTLKYVRDMVQQLCCAGFCYSGDVNRHSFLIPTRIKSLVDAGVVSNYLRLLTVATFRGGAEISMVIDTISRRHLKRLQIITQRIYDDKNNLVGEVPVLRPRHLLMSIYHRVMLHKLLEMINFALDITEVLKVCNVPSVYYDIVRPFCFTGSCTIDEKELACFTGTMKVLRVTSPDEL